MRGERLFRILGLVDEDLIEEAGTASSAAPFKGRRAGAMPLAAAACLTLACSLLWLATGGLQGFGGSDGAAPMAGESGGSGHQPGTAFMSYAGPVLPLTALEADTGLTAERRITWDFAPRPDQGGEAEQWGAVVTDDYTLANPTGEDVTVTALYPFAGSLSSLDHAPRMAVDGQAAEAALLAGPYAGGFSGVYEESGPDDSTWNLRPPAGWEDYRALLADGSYLAGSLEPWPALDMPVTVYEFTELAAPEGADAATQAVSFTIDQARTKIFSYGFEGMSWDEETGWRQYSYFVPDGRRSSTEPKLLAVLGEDIGDYALQGYADGGCDMEIEGVSCTVTRTETTFDALVEGLCGEYLAKYDGKNALLPPGVAEQISPDFFRGAVADLVTRYGLLSDGPVDRYSDGRLDDLLGEALSVKRVLYLSLPVTVPAGSSVTVTASLWKEPSYDFGGSGTGSEGVQGFDLATRLGSSLPFTGQTAALANPQGVEIVRQNLGFDLEGGVTEVPLDPAEEYYYLEVRPLEAE